jgi:hypothetical protein
MLYKVYLRAREGRAPLLCGGLEEEWGEEPELFYILGPVPTLAWVAQVSEGQVSVLFGRPEDEWGEEPELFYILGSRPHPSLGSAGE